MKIRQEDSEESLSARILSEEHRAYPDAVRAFATGRITVDGRKVKLKDE